MKRLPIPFGVALTVAAITATAASTQPAAELLRQAQAGDPVAERNLGHAYLQGDGVERDIATGARWLDRAAQHNDPYAAFLLGEHYETLPDTAENRTLVVRYYRQAAELGHTTAQVKLALMFLSRGDAGTLDTAARTHANDQAIALLSFAAKANNGVANVTLADIYARGLHGIATDQDKALDLYRKGAALHQIAASVWLADHYLGNRGAKTYNAAEGVAFLRQAAEGNIPSAALDLAERYDKGDGVEKNRDEALRWAQKALQMQAPGAAELIAQINATTVPPLAAVPPAAADQSKPTATAAFTQPPAAHDAHVVVRKVNDHATSKPEPLPQDTRLASAPPAANSAQDQPAKPPKKVAEAPLPTAELSAPKLTEPLPPRPDKAEPHPAIVRDEQPYVDSRSIADRVSDMERRVVALEHENTTLIKEVSQSREEITMLEQHRADALVHTDSSRASHEGRQHAWRNVAPNKPAPAPKVPPQEIAIVPQDSRWQQRSDKASEANNPNRDSDMSQPESAEHAALAQTDKPIAQPAGTLSHEHPAPSASPVTTALVDTVHVHDHASGAAPEAVAPVAFEAAHEPSVPHAAALGAVDSKHAALQPAQEIVPPTATAHVAPTLDPPAPASNREHVTTPRVESGPMIDHDAELANEQGVTALRDGNYTQAVAHFRRAAVTGNSRAMNNLGMAYFRGWGVERNIAEAVGYFERAAHSGDGGAANNLGYIYQYGVGVVPDRTRAVAWYRRAVELGNSSSRKALSELLTDQAAIHKTANES